MLRQLKKKFIIINMGLTASILLIILAAMCGSSYSRLSFESTRAMLQALERPPKDMPARQEIGRGPGPDAKGNIFFTPVAIVDVNADGSYTISETLSNATISEAALAQALPRVQNSEDESGLLLSLSLRYLKRDTPEGTRIAFADTSLEMRSFYSLILTSCAIFAASLAVLFLISLFLAGWALKPVQKAWEQQRQFVADASHELKTPLTVILANTGILLSHKEDTIAGRLKWVENTQTEAGRMKKLVDDLLYLARADARQLPVVKSDVNFSDLVWSCLLPFESLAYEQQITIEEDITPDILLRGDSAQLKQLVVILLDNACKYAGKGGRVRLGLRREHELIVLSVNNNGTLIPAEDLEHIFERFYRSDKSRVLNTGGYGLGLAIARSITDAHQGKIAAASSTGEGTTFTVSFR